MGGRYGREGHKDEASIVLGYLSERAVCSGEWLRVAGKERVEVLTDK